MKNKTNLFLIVTKRWYEEIVSGRKRVEYRRDCSYWFRRLSNTKHKNAYCNEEPAIYETVEFQCGYSRRHPRRMFKVVKIEAIKTPEEVKDTVKTEYCFAIHFE